MITVLTSLFTVSFFATQMAHGQRTADSSPSGDRAVREAFIRTAMQSEDRKLKARETELHERGIMPTLSASAVISPFADWDYYYVHRGWILWEPNAGLKIKKVEVPEGFVTDLASIPRVFWQVLKPEGRHAYAAVVHDYLYWEQDRSREEADLVFKVAMQDSGVNPQTVTTLYTAVRKFGQRAWDKNAQLKRSGERRLLKQFPRDFKVSWKEWKSRPDVFDVPAPDQEVPPLKLKTPYK